MLLVRQLMSPANTCQYCIHTDPSTNAFSQSPPGRTVLDVILQTYPIHVSPPSIMHRSGPIIGTDQQQQQQSHSDGGEIQVLAPKPKHHPNLTKSPKSASSPTLAEPSSRNSHTMDRSPHRGGGGGLGGDGSPSARPQNIKGATASPSLRAHGLSALSPLQTFSPLHTHKELRDSSTLASAAASDGSRTPGSESNRSRAGSLTRSLSRRESLYRSAEIWNKDEDAYKADHQQTPAEMFSRLTLVKAPVKKEGMSIRQ